MKRGAGLILDPVALKVGHQMPTPLPSRHRELLPPHPHLPLPPAPLLLLLTAVERSTLSWYPRVSPRRCSSQRLSSPSLPLYLHHPLSFGGVCLKLVYRCYYKEWDSPYFHEQLEAAMVCILTFKAQRHCVFSAVFTKIVAEQVGSRQVKLGQVLCMLQKNHSGAGGGGRKLDVIFFLLQKQLRGRSGSDLD